MEYLHTMLRVRNLKESLDFYVGKLGFREVGKLDFEADRLSIVFLGAPGDDSTTGWNGRFAPILELYAYWDESVRAEWAKRPWGHIAYRVDNIYETCAKLMAEGVQILRPPRDGFQAFLKTPEGVTMELIQRQPSLEPTEPWKSMPDTGDWSD